MIKIALGTTSEQKRAFVEEILKELEIAAETISVEVASGIAEQPITSAITKKGSVNRAKRALEKTGADIGLGVEIGYHKNKIGDYEMFCWTTLVEKTGKSFSAQSHKLLLPKFHQQILKENKYLGEYVREFLKLYPDPVSQNVGIIIRDRKPFIQTATKMVLLNYFVKQ